MLSLGIAILVEIDPERGVGKVFVKIGGKDRRHREQDEADDELEDSMHAWVPPRDRRPRAFRAGSFPVIVPEQSVTRSEGERN